MVEGRGDATVAVAGYASCSVKLVAPVGRTTSSPRGSGGTRSVWTALLGQRNLEIGVREIGTHAAAYSMSRQSRRKSIGCSRLSHWTIVRLLVDGCPSKLQPRGQEPDLLALKTAAPILPRH